jgi:hypothetical protein
MTDATPTPFTLVGDPNAAVCDGDVCEIPSVARADGAPSSSPAN